MTWMRLPWCAEGEGMVCSRVDGNAKIGSGEEA